MESEADAESSQPQSVKERVKYIRDKERVVGCSPNNARGPTLADATCNQLWVERNAYYKVAKYCFRTSRATAYFGNDGCAKDIDEDGVEAKLSDVVRGRISEITNLERRYGCN